MRIYALLGDETLANDATYLALQKHHQELLAAYRAYKWDEAQSAQEQCVHLAQKIMPSLVEGLYVLFAERIAEIQGEPTA